MDKLSGLASKLSGKNKDESKGSGEDGGSSGSSGGGDKDYLDKGWSSSTIGLLHTNESRPGICREKIRWRKGRP